MAVVRRFLFDELKTYSSSFVDEQVRDYNRLPAVLQQCVFDQVMEFKVRSRNLNHVAEAITEIHPVLGRADLSLRRRTYLMALIAVANYRLGQLGLCSSVLTELMQMRTDASPDTHSMINYLETHLVTSPVVFVAKAVAKTVVLGAGVYFFAKHGGTVINGLKGAGEGLKHAALHNTGVTYRDGKFGLVLQYPGHN